jgi:hypothetical protein
MEATKRPSCISKWQYSSTKSKIVNNFNPVCQAVQKLTLKGKFVITLNQKKSIPGKFISVQIYSGTEVDPSKFISLTNMSQYSLEQTTILEIVGVRQFGLSIVLTAAISMTKKVIRSYNILFYLCFVLTSWTTYFVFNFVLH